MSVLDTIGEVKEAGLAQVLASADTAALEAARVALLGKKGSLTAILRSMGFKSVEVDSVASPYGGLILQVQVNGHAVAPGTSVGINSHIRLTVGDGSIDNLNPDSILDSHTIDSIEQHNYEQAIEDYKTKKND